MKTNVRTFAISILSGSLIALGSSIAIAQTVNNIDNTTPGAAGHGTGCSNFAGGCQASPVSTAHGAYRPKDELGIGAPTNSNTGTSAGSAYTAPDASAPLNSCMDAADATPGHCMSGGTNK